LKNLRYAFYISILLFAGCASIPPVAPQNGESSIVGISVKISGRIYAPYPDSIFLIKLNEKEKSCLSENEFLTSNFQEDGRYYFLNAEPGRYIAIGAFRKSESADAYGNSSKVRPDDYIYYFPADMVQLTDTTIKKGESAFMGEYETHLPFNFEYGIKNPDDAQLYYCKRLQPNKAEPSAFGCCIETFTFFGGGTGDTAEAVKLKGKTRDNKSEINFWMNAKKHFKPDSLQKIQYREPAEKNILWQEIIDRKIKKLENE